MLVPILFITVRLSRGRRSFIYTTYFLLACNCLCWRSENIYNSGFYIKFWFCTCLTVSLLIVWKYLHLWTLYQILVLYLPVIVSVDRPKIFTPLDSISNFGSVRACHYPVDRLKILTPLDSISNFGSVLACHCLCWSSENIYTSWLYIKFWFCTCLSLSLLIVQKYLHLWTLYQILVPYLLVIVSVDRLKIFTPLDSISNFG
jgi:hypothetical protein